MLGAATEALVAAGSLSPLTTSGLTYTNTITEYFRFYIGERRWTLTFRLPD